ncbi:RNA polymerase sigma factor SigI [Alicyclobacillus shizuokensis]|uniref:RNA polymerase sigma factor SigI n=1 Tax=Alicyclobacillus shizuokensis TaxID=392014 RepID=UPI00082FFE72|nr:RNA polymerase sigma factor SigI [Alicyclobacillus shizuokensis]MCL6625989.1 RNA polymerase sigma factor SigI [Alicyclobacillus shizuokensis]
MGGFPFRRKTSQDPERLYPLLRLAQSGDEQARSDLIEAYVPFALRIASQASRRYIDPDRDDEFSIALMGMNEAIDRFDPSKKVNFLGFAETIIRRRLIDYFRSQRLHGRTVPWTDFDVVDEGDNVINYVEVRTSLDAYEREEEERRRRQEIEEYAKRLREFGLSFQELVKVSPKHADARQNAMEIARLVAADDELRRYVMERRALPLKQLQERVHVSRKTLERQRKYILAVILLLCGDYATLQDYIS